MMIKNKQNIIANRIVSLIVTILFSFNSVASGLDKNKPGEQNYTLSATSRVNPLVKVEEKNGEIIVYENIGELYGLKTDGTIREDVAFLYLVQLISQVIADFGEKIDGDGLKRLILRDLSHVDFANFDITGIYKEGEAFCVPYVNNGKTFNLHISKNEEYFSENPAKFPIEVKDKKVFCEIEPGIKAEVRKFIWQNLPRPPKTEILEAINRILDLLEEWYGWDLLERIIEKKDLGIGELKDLTEKVKALHKKEGLLKGNPLFLDFLEKHDSNVASIAEDVFKACGYDEKTAALYVLTGWAHDIGKAKKAENLSLHYDVRTRTEMGDEELARIHDHAEDTLIILENEKIALPMEAILAIAINHSVSWREEEKKVENDWKTLLTKVNPALAKRVKLLPVADQFSAFTEPRSYIDRVVLRGGQNIRLWLSFTMNKKQQLVDDQTIDMLEPTLTPKVLHPEGSILEAYEIMFDNQRFTEEEFELSMYSWARRKETQSDSGEMFFAQETVQKEMDYLVAIGILEQGSSNNKYKFSEKYKKISTKDPIDVYIRMKVRHTLRPYIGEQSAENLQKLRQKLDECFVLVPKYFLGENENIYLGQHKIRILFDKIGISPEEAEEKPWMPYGKLKEAKENILTPEEHELLFDYLWGKSVIELSFPGELKRKLIARWREIPIDAIVRRKGIDAHLIYDLINKKIVTTFEEERFLWQIFHRTIPEWCNRKFGEISDQVPEILIAINDVIAKSKDKLKVLELGSGPEGMALQQLKGAYKERIEAVGVDLEIYDKKTEGVTLLEANIRKLPFENESFDLLYENMVLFWAEGELLEKSVLEAMRVLKAGGTFIFRTLIEVEKIKELFKKLGIEVEIVKQGRIFVVKKLPPTEKFLSGNAPKRGGFAMVEVLAAITGAGLIGSFPASWIMGAIQAHPTLIVPVFYAVSAIIVLSIILPQILHFVENSPAEDGQTVDYALNAKIVLKLYQFRMEEAALRAKTDWYDYAEVAIGILKKLKDIDPEYSRTARSFSSSFKKAEELYEPSSQFKRLKEPPVEELVRLDSIVDALDELLFASYARELAESGFFGAALNMWGKVNSRSELDKKLYEKAFEGYKTGKECLKNPDAIPEKEKFDFYLRILADAIINEDEKTKNEAMEYFKEKIFKSKKEAKKINKRLNKLLNFKSPSSAQALTSVAVMHIITLLPDEYITLELVRKVVQFLKYRGGLEELVLSQGRHFFESIPDRLVYKNIDRNGKDLRSGKKATEKPSYENRYFNEISKYPMLTGVGEIKLSVLIKFGDLSARETFIKANLRAAVWIAKRFLKPERDFMQMVHAGNEGLIEAVERYDPTRGAKFLSYGAVWIRKEVLSYIYENKSVINIPWRAIEQFKKECSEAGLDPKDEGITSEEIAKATGRTFDWVIRMRREMNHASISLNNDVSEFGSSRPLNPEDVIGAEDRALEEKINEMERQALSVLEREEKENKIDAPTQNEKASNLEMQIMAAQGDLNAVRNKMESTAKADNRDWIEYAKKGIKILRRMYKTDPNFKETLLQFKKSFNLAKRLYDPSKESRYKYLGRPVAPDKRGLERELGEHSKYLRSLKKYKEELDVLTILAAEENPEKSSPVSSENGQIRTAINEALNVITNFKEKEELRKKKAVEINELMEKSSIQLTVEELEGMIEAYALYKHGLDSLMNASNRVISQEIEMAIIFTLKNAPYLMSAVREILNKELGDEKIDYARKISLLEVFILGFNKENPPTNEDLDFLREILNKSQKIGETMKRRFLYSIFDKNTELDVPEDIAALFREELYDGADKDLSGEFFRIRAKRENILKYLATEGMPDPGLRTETAFKSKKIEDAREEILKKQENGIYNLLFVPENSRKLLILAANLRLVYPFERMRIFEGLEGNLERAISEGVYFPLGDNIFITPYTESFRRHIIFRMNEDKKVLFAVEIKMPGEDSHKKIVSMNDYEIGRYILEHNASAPVVEPLVFFQLADEEINLYGKREKYDFSYNREHCSYNSCNFAVFSYSEDGRRLMNISVKGFKDIAARYEIYAGDVKKVAEDITRQVLSITAMFHTFGYRGFDEVGTDMHLENFRIICGRTNVKIVFVNDFAAFNKPSGDEDKLRRIFELDLNRFISAEVAKGLSSSSKHCLFGSHGLLARDCRRIYNEEREKWEEKLSQKPTLQAPSEEIVKTKDEAQEFLNDIILQAEENKREKRMTLIAIDTAWIPEVQLDSKMGDLLRALKDMGITNVKIVYGKGGQILGRIEKAEEELKRKFDKKDMIIISKKRESGEENMFQDFEGINAREEGAFFVDIVFPGKAFRDNCDTQLLYIIREAVKRAYAKEGASRRWEFVLKAEPLDIKVLLDELERQTEKISA